MTMFFNIPKIGLSEVLSNWLGWFTVSQSRTTSWRGLANSKILSISFWTSAKLALREFERSSSARLDGLFRTFFLAWKIKNGEHYCLSKSYSSLLSKYQEKKIAVMTKFHSFASTMRHACTLYITKSSNFQFFESSNSLRAHLAKFLNKIKRIFVLEGFSQQKDSLGLVLNLGRIGTQSVRTLV